MYMYMYMMYAMTASVHRLYSDMGGGMGIQINHRNEILNCLKRTSKITRDCTLYNIYVYITHNWFDLMSVEVERVHWKRQTAQMNIRFHSPPSRPQAPPQSGQSAGQRPTTEQNTCGD